MESLRAIGSLRYLDQLFLTLELHIDGADGFRP